MQRLIRILLPIVILAGGALGFRMLIVKEEAPRGYDRPERVLKTEVIELERQDFQTIVQTQGEVRPLNDAILTAEVSGKVHAISDSLHDGSFFEAGEILLEIAGEDYETEVIAAEASLSRALAEFAQEETKSKQARLNWNDLGYVEEPNELVLRLPQLREAEANVKAAEAALERAKRNLDRTRVRAPFAGRILSRLVSVGQTVSPNTELATMFNTDYVEVRLPIAARDLSFLHLPESIQDKPVKVELRDALSPDSPAQWPAEIIGTEGALDPDSRELFAIARVRDPFSRAAAPDQARPPLRIGQPVVASIPGRTLNDVHLIPRQAVRQLTFIYLVDPVTLTLERREIQPVWSDQEQLVLADPTLADGSLLATSKLVYAPNLSKVEILPSSEEATDREDPPSSKESGETPKPSAPSGT
ncbi:MAG: efflux RND transporter periplasmic adaptor subunit [Verrucomicrobiales bacterium]|nr:efflux RND transporter periplasmic adaptor subunit [Verrucomicrobiales bacterium]